MRPFRMTPRTWTAAVAILGLIIACYHWVFCPTLVLVERARPPQSVSLDDEIFDIVLSDLIENQEFNPATGGRGVEKHQIVLGDTTMVGFGRIGETRFGLDRWCREKGIPLEVQDDFSIRNPKGKRCVLARYRPSNPNILVRALGPIDRDLGFSARFPDARGYVETHLPGYSRDGATALVVFTFGPTPHGATGCYLLGKMEGQCVYSGVPAAACHKQQHRGTESHHHERGRLGNCGAGHNDAIGLIQPCDERGVRRRAGGRVFANCAVAFVRDKKIRPRYGNAEGRN